MYIISNSKYRIPRPFRLNRWKRDHERLTWKKKKVKKISRLKTAAWRSIIFIINQKNWYTKNAYFQSKCSLMMKKRLWTTNRTFSALSYSMKVNARQVYSLYFYNVERLRFGLFLRQRTLNCIQFYSNDWAKFIG